jgi:hypothetical protein
VKYCLIPERFPRGKVGKTGRTIGIRGVRRNRAVGAMSRKTGQTETAVVNADSDVSPSEANVRDCMWRCLVAKKLVQANGKFAGF